MKLWKLIFLGFLAVSSCAPTSTSKPNNTEIEPVYDFKCSAIGPGGENIKYGYYKFQMDATAYNMGIRNFIRVQVKVDDRFNSFDINEGSTYYNEKAIVISSSRGGFQFKTNFNSNAGTDSTIEAEFLNNPVSLSNIICQ